MENNSPLQHLAPQQRNFSMDVMRGMAVLGILLMNIAAFSSHEFLLVWNDTIARRLTLDGFIFKSVLLLFDGRMRGLFTLLFGAGLMLFVQNKQNQSIQVADAYFRRMMWLLLFGMFDSYLLLWTGDVLFEYALCGIFIYAFRNLRARYMLLLAFVCLAGFTYINSKPFDEYKAKAMEYQRIEKRMQEGKSISEDEKKNFDDYEINVLGRHYPFSDTSMKKIQNEMDERNRIHRSGYLEILENHAAETYDYHSQVFFSIFGESFGTIMLGMALFKLGFFHGRLRRKVYAWMAVLGIVLGLALVAVFMKLQVRTREELWYCYSWRNFSIIYFEEGGRVLCTLGYAAFIYLLCQVNALRSFLNLFSSVGRMALTNYLMQTILCSFYFFGFGLGHFGEYNASQLLVFVCCIWIIQISYSHFYLKYFKMGPAEWLWKRLTYGKGFGQNKN